MILVAVIGMLVGFCVGILSGLLGVGGGSILVPVFLVGFGMPAAMATGTSLFTIIFTSISGAITRIRNKTCDVRMGLLMGVGGAVTSPLGAWLASHSPDLLIVVAVSVVILYSMYTIVLKALKKPAAASAAPEAPATQESAAATEASVSDETATTPAVPAAPAAASSSASSKTPSIANPPLTAPLVVKGIIIGLVTGVVSGYVGLGGGFLMIPMMTTLLGYSMHKASGTSLVGIICIALSGAIAQITFGNVDLLVGIMVTCGSIPGAVIGGRFVTRFNERTLRLMFGGLLVVAVALLYAKQFGLLG